MNKKTLLKQATRFVIIGFINTGNYYVLYLFLYMVLHAHYMAAHIAAFGISMIGSFFLNSYFTYESKPTLKKFFQFPLTYVVNITVATSALFILTDLMKMNGKITPLLASAIAIPFTFVLSRKILADNRNPEPE